jgi:CcmD family protein
MNELPTATSATAVAPAPSTSASATVEDRASSFRAVTGGGEQVNGGKLLIAAYAVVWAVLLALVVRAFRKQSSTAERIDALEKAVSRKAPRAGKEAS